jgi:hypothetical protein
MDAKSIPEDQASSFSKSPTSPPGALVVPIYVWFPDGRFGPMMGASKKRKRNGADSPCVPGTPIGAVLIGCRIRALGSNMASLLS